MIPPKHAANLAASVDRAIKKNWQEILRQMLESSRHIGFDPASPNGDKAMMVVTETINGIPTVVSIDEATEVTQEMIDEILGHPPKATEIAQGVTLFTRDGAHIGNAIVVQKTGVAITRPGKGLVPVWLVETDFGNQLRLIEDEILTLFTLGRQTTYGKWFDDRLELLKQRTEEL